MSKGVMHPGLYIYIVIATGDVVRCAPKTHLRCCPQLALHFEESTQVIPSDGQILLRTLMLANAHSFFEVFFRFVQLSRLEVELTLSVVGDSRREVLCSQRRLFDLDRLKMDTLGPCDVPLTLRAQCLVVQVNSRGQAVGLFTSRVDVRSGEHVQSR